MHGRDAASQDTHHSVAILLECLASLDLATDTSATRCMVYRPLTWSSLGARRRGMTVSLLTRTGCILIARARADISGPGALRKPREHSGSFLINPGVLRVWSHTREARYADGSPFQRCRVNARCVPIQRITAGER
ncbi:hypothetical protein C8Q77DRAFT_466669 [Trametes polyzona]|nr:hypothetical protein C8Q77DRAFT_466669 [Trametes polyzona]